MYLSVCERQPEQKKGNDMNTLQKSNADDL